jgi:type II secretory pathway component PulF
MFSKQMSILITSGVSLVEALRIQYEQEDSQYFRGAIMGDRGHGGRRESFSEGSPIFLTPSRISSSTS